MIIYSSQMFFFCSRFGGFTIDTDIEKSEDEEAFERKLVCKFTVFFFFFYSQCKRVLNCCNTEVGPVLCHIGYLIVEIKEFNFTLDALLSTSHCRYIYKVNIQADSKELLLLCPLFSVFPSPRAWMRVPTSITGYTWIYFGMELSLIISDWLSYYFPFNILVFHFPIDTTISFETNLSLEGICLQLIFSLLSVMY